MKQSRLMIGAAAGFVAAVCLLVWGCPLALMPELSGSGKKAGVGDGSVVREYNLLAYVPVPTEGAAPVKTVEGRLDLEGPVVWMDEGGQELPETFAAFELGAVYQGAITLRAKDTYTFDPALSFKYYPAEAVTSQPETDTDAGDAGRTRVRSVTVTYKAAAQDLVTVNDLDLTDKVPAPVAGGKAEPYVNAPQYAGNVIWTTEGDKPPEGVFATGKVYTATVELVAASGYTFTGVTKNSFTHTGSSGEGPANAANSGTVTIVFPATTNETAKTVNDFDLTGKIPVPVANRIPTLLFTSTQYSGNVVWTPDPKGYFQKGTAYTATVRLIAASGYVFTVLKEDAFEHKGASKHPTNVEDSALVTITFPVNDFLVVTDLDLTPYLPAPEEGESPQLTLLNALSKEPPQYSGIVLWKDSKDNVFGESSTFKAGETYTATVTLTAKGDYNFNGVAKDAFKHNGALATNPANSGVVTINGLRVPAIENPWF